MIGLSFCYLWRDGKSFMPREKEEDWVVTDAEWLSDPKHFHGTRSDAFAFAKRLGGVAYPKL